MASYPTNLQKVAIYLRKSRADIEAEASGEGETLSKHRKALFELAKKQRYGIEAVYEEIVSGERIIDRPEMQRLLEDVSEHKYSAVLCMDLDRLGRGNQIDQGIIQESFKFSKTLIITPRKVYDLEDEMDEEWSEFESFMARRELKIITRRLQRGRRMSAAEGHSISKKPPYGYLRDENLKLYPDPETAPVVKTIFEMISGGEGIRTAANYLTDHGIPTPSGKSNWDKSSVTSIVKNEVYLGHIIWGKVKYKKKRISGKGYERTAADPEDWTVKENAHEPLVDQALFDLAQKALKDRHPSYLASTEPVNPFASLIFCSYCGRNMQHRKRYHRPYNTLLCVTRNCKTRGARFEFVESRIIQTLKEMLPGFEAGGEKTKKKKSNNAALEMANRRITSIESEIKELEEQYDSLHEWLEKKIYSVEKFLERSRVVGEKIEEAKNQLAKAYQEAEQLKSEEQRRNEFAPKMRQILDRYDQTESVKQKNAMLREIIDHIVYHRPKEWTETDHFELEIHLKI